jgi:hypothetical protein
MGTVTYTTYRCRKCGVTENEKSVDSFSLGQWVEYRR